MTTVIIEDENRAVKKLSRLLSADGGIEIMAVLKSIPESREWLGTHPAPDLIFMDIKPASDQSFEAFKDPLVFVFRPTAGMEDHITGRTRFLVKSGKRMASIETSDIAYFYVDRRVIFLKTFDNKKFIVNYTLDAVDAMLDHRSFFRINRACMVAAKAVRDIVPFSGCRLSLCLNPSFNSNLLVSRERVKAFKKWIGQ
ncbi:LytR/AlgR family response regulator transcription factor [Niabella hirudinis]|uniref:LytR/AlgR family response regulator transcription factor n=1 Tax=Niabella hirudinis TaxID=1285929 RepID=UPI003EBB1582